VLIEAAIGISVFLCLLIIGMDLMRLAYINYAGRYVAEQSARAAAAGDHTLSPDARVPSIKQNIIAIARAFSLAFTADNIQICAGTAPGCLTESAGGPEQEFTIQIRYPQSVLGLSASQFTFRFEATAKNERY